VKSNVAGKKKGAVMPIGGLMKNVAEKRIGELQIKSGFVRRRCRRVEERCCLDEDRHREASRISERVARERALADKRRKEEEACSRDRWAHRSEMLPGASSHLEDMNRSIDVSLNNSSSIPPPMAATRSDRVDVSLN
jgi:hypothetical protein